MQNDTFETPLSTYLGGGFIALALTAIVAVSFLYG